MSERLLPMDIPVELAQMLGMRDEPGYVGTFTRQQAIGAYPSGTRIEKCNTEPGDTRPDGAQGVVLGSIGIDGVVIYFVEWDSAKFFAVSVAGHRVKEVQS